VEQETFAVLLFNGIDKNSVRISNIAMAKSRAIFREALVCFSSFSVAFGLNLTIGKKRFKPELFFTARPTFDYEVMSRYGQQIAPLPLDVVNNAPQELPQYLSS